MVSAAPPRPIMSTLRARPGWTQGFFFRRGAGLALWSDGTWKYGPNRSSSSLAMAWPQTAQMAKWSSSPAMRQSLVWQC